MKLKLLLFLTDPEMKTLDTLCSFHRLTRDEYAEDILRRFLASAAEDLKDENVDRPRAFKE